MELAHLIIRVDGQGVEKAAKDLDGVRVSSSRLEAQEERRANKARDDANKAAKAAEVWKKKYTDAADAQFSYDSKIAASAAKRTNALERSWQLQSAIEAKRIAAAERDAAREAAIEAKRVAVAQDAERKIQEARQKTIDKARLENRFSGSGGGWGGGGGGGGSINGVPSDAFGKPKGLLPGINYANIASTVGPLAAGLGIGFGLNEIKNTIVEMEVLEARLLTVAGSAQKANEMFSTLKILDRQLPHDIGELTGAFVNLVHLGLTPSEEALRSYSAISSASSKSIEDVVLAVSRGVANDYRRIRSLGVEAVVVGDKVKLTFNNISETVDRTKAGLEGYFIKLGQSSTFAEASANKMKTLAGSISNLDSAWKNFISSMSKGGVSDTLGKLVQGLTLVLDGWNYILTTFTRQVERAGEVAGHISKMEFKEAATKGAKGVASGLTFGISDAALDDPGAPASLAAAKAPPAIKTELEIIDELAEAAKEKYDKERKVIEMELRFADDFSVLNQKYRDTQKEIDELEIEGQNAEFVRLDIKHKAYADYSRKVKALEDKKRTDSIARSASIRSRIEASWDEGDKRKADFEFFLGKKGGDESAIFAEHTKMSDYVLKMTVAGSKEEEKALAIVSAKTVESFKKLADARRDILKQEYEDRERQIQRAFRNSDGKEVERLNKSKENWQNYVDAVSKISVGDGAVPAPDPGDAPFTRELTKPERDDIKFKNLESKYETELRMLQESREAQGMTDKQYTDESRRLWRQYTADLGKISTTGALMVYTKNLEMSSTVLGMSATIAGQLDQLAQGQGDAAKATFLAVKSISIAQAIINTELAATRAYVEGGFFAGIPMSVAIRGLGYASVAIMAATSAQEYSGKFADGGFLGGSQTTGDRVLFHGNAGEAVLNGNQQRNFMALANGQGGNQNAPIINIYNNASGATATARTNEMGEIEVFIEELDKRGAANIMSGKSRVARALEKTHGLRRTGMAS